MNHPHTMTAAASKARRAFTLVELMVVMVIIAVLSALTLAGLAGVRQRAREDKTKSTIRKIDAVIRPMYESYRTRRIPLDVTFQPNVRASNKLVELRRLMVHEMPDSWNDVASMAEFNDTNHATEFGAFPYLRNARVRAYVTYKANLNPSLMYGSAECLYMIISLGGFEPDALEMFRSDETGDIDGDGAAEFLDGWGRPIAFFRWAPGFSAPLSPIQVADPVAAHDPFDPWQLDMTQPGGLPRGFALVPLIFSAGPDEATNDPLSSSESGYGLSRLGGGSPPNSWRRTSLGSIADVLNENGVLVGAPDPANPSAYLDNITNHDLSAR